MAASQCWSDWIAGWFDPKTEIFQIPAIAGVRVGCSGRRQRM
jgi:hypothetical protein